MPLYPYKCTCGHTDDYLLPMEHEAPKHCRKRMERVYTPFSFTIDFTAGYDMGAGKYFDTKRERENWIAKSNVKRI